MPAAARARAQNLLLLLLGLGVGLLACELVTRAFWSSFAPSHGYFEIDAQGRISPTTPFLPDPRLGWRRPPGARLRYSAPEYSAELQINAQGFRSPHDFMAGTPARPVIALLGDSVTEAAQVDDDETVAALLQRTLEAKGLSAEIQSFAVSSYGFPHYLAAYRHFARMSHPRLVVVCAFLTNDILDSSPIEKDVNVLRPRYALATDGAIQDIQPFDAPAAGFPPTNGVKAYFRSHLALYKLLLWARYGAGARRPSATGGFDILARVYEEPWPAELVEAWRYAAWCLTTLAREVRADGGELLAVAWPSRLTTAPGAWGDFERRYRAAFPERRLDSGLPERRLGELLQELGVPFEDSRERLSGAYRQGCLAHYPQDGHFTACGNRAAASSLEALVFPHLNPRARLQPRMSKRRAIERAT